MVHIKITKGLDVPIVGKPTGKIQELKLSGTATAQGKPRLIALNLDPFDDVRFKLLAKDGDTVSIGSPLVEDKSTPGRVFASPAAGTIKEIRRGLKRRLIDIVIEVAEEEAFFDHGTLDPQSASEEAITQKLLQGGLFAHIHTRPFNVLAAPDKKPRNIFVKALESAPFTPPTEMQIEGHEEDFQWGIDALAKLTTGKVHLVIRKECNYPPLKNARNATIHTAEGPHPVSSPSLHIQYLDPITSYEDIIWTVNARDVVGIGHLLRTGRYLIDRVIAIAGPAIIPGQTGYFKVRAGYPIESLIAGRIPKGPVRLISGNPLTGKRVEPSDFLGFEHVVLCAVAENTHREFLHFLRLGLDKFSFSRAYVSGILGPYYKNYNFTTNQHGEKRAFIDPTLYDKVQPLAVSTMALVKAVMAEDYDLAEELGLLSVDSEDFALTTFVCPSKIEMTEIIKQGLRAYKSEALE